MLERQREGIRAAAAAGKYKGRQPTVMRRAADIQRMHADGMKPSRSSTITEEPTMRVTTHPGEVLREEFMLPLGLSANALSRELHVPPNRITGITADHDRRAVTPDTALRLARYFGTSPEFWLNLQGSYDLSVAMTELGKEIAERVRPRAA
jgi:antitoxin HigA-1